MITAQPILSASGLSIRRFREAVGGHTSTVSRAISGPITTELADRWCCRLGFHPAEVYGATLWLAAIASEVGSR